MSNLSAAAMSDLLDQEYALIRSGDFDGLSRLLGEKEASIRALSEGPRVPRDAAVELADKANRNQRVLEAAGNGLRDAMRRLGELRRLQDGFDSYSPNGQRQTAPKSGRGHRV